MANAGVAVLNKAAASDPDIDPETRSRAQARDTFGVFCMGFADGEFDLIGSLLSQSLRLSWRPVLLSPRRLLVVALFLLAKITPGPLYRKIWQLVASIVFRLKPGETFLTRKEQ
jgi:hypothetical protein